MENNLVEPYKSIYTNLQAEFKSFLYGFCSESDIILVNGLLSWIDKKLEQQNLSSTAIDLDKRLELKEMKWALEFTALEVSWGYSPSSANIPLYEQKEKEITIIRKNHAALVDQLKENDGPY